MLGAIAHYEGQGMTREEAELEAFRETTERQVKRRWEKRLDFCDL